MRGSVRLRIHTLDRHEPTISASVLGHLKSGVGVTGKRPVLLSLSRLCGHVCIILLSSGGLSAPHIPRAEAV
jgi:hypothetical protein